MLYLVTMLSFYHLSKAHSVEKFRKRYLLKFPVSIPTRKIDTFVLLLSAIDRKGNKSARAADLARMRVRRMSREMLTSVSRLEKNNTDKHF